MNNSQNGDVRIVLAVAALVSLLSWQASAQDRANGEKWRPKEGIYVSAGRDYAERCNESTELVVELREKVVGGNEWNCKVDRLVDIASNTLRLDLTCNDYNLAEDLNGRDPNPYDRKFKEIMTLRKIDGSSFLVRKTLNGKSGVAERKVVYCPGEAQKSYLAAKARDRDAAQRKAATKGSAPEPAKW